jgi:hypothetical protein
MVTVTSLSATEVPTENGSLVTRQRSSVDRTWNVRFPIRVTRMSRVFPLIKNIFCGGAFPFFERRDEEERSTARSSAKRAIASGERCARVAPIVPHLERRHDVFPPLLRRIKGTETRTLRLHSAGSAATLQCESEVVMLKMRSHKRRPFRRDSGDAFLPDPASGTYISVPDAESVAEEFIASATSADCVLEDARNELSMDELGGPFIEEDDTIDVFD